MKKQQADIPYAELVQKLRDLANAQAEVNYGDPASVQRYYKRIKQIQQYVDTIDTLYPEEIEPFCKAVVQEPYVLLRHTLHAILKMEHVPRIKKAEILKRAEQYANDPQIPIVDRIVFQFSVEQAKKGGTASAPSTSPSGGLSVEEDEAYELMRLDLYGMDEDRMLQEQRNCYCLLLLEEEMENGGVLQFLVNSSGKAAPEIGPALRKIGFPFLSFAWSQALEQNQIDLNDRSSLECRSLQAYQNLEQRYDFRSFERYFYQEQAELHRAMVGYLRLHLAGEATVCDENVLSTGPAPKGGGGVGLDERTLL